MNLNSILNQFQSNTAGNSQQHNQQHNQQASGLSGLMDKIPAGLAGGAAAGSIMTLLMSNKSARKVAGKAAGYGGAAVLGGLAFKAFNNWKSNNGQQELAAKAQLEPSYTPSNSGALQPNLEYASTQTEQTQKNTAFQLTLIKSMIAASKADGHIDDEEQKNIFDAVKKCDLSNDDKAAVFDLLRQPIYMEELNLGANTLEQKAEVYLAACLAINIDTQAEEAYLNKLATTLDLPPDLALQLKAQAD